jgi:putative SOS response-associated peptidase YedK
MCGRFSLNITLEEIRQHFSADVVTCEWKPWPEVFPSQQVPAIIMHESGKRLGLLTWGLIPSWAKEKRGAVCLCRGMGNLAERLFRLHHYHQRSRRRDQGYS